MRIRFRKAVKGNQPPRGAAGLMERADTEGDEDQDGERKTIARARMDVPSEREMLPGLGGEGEGGKGGGKEERPKT